MAWEIVNCECPDLGWVFTTCECCIDPVVVPDPVVRYPYVITKLFNRITVGECDIKANQIFGEAVYDQVKKLRYGIQTACPIDIDMAWLNKELSDLSSIYNPDMCVITVPDPCCPEPEECVYPTSLVCAPPSDISTTPRWDCEEPELINVSEEF
jgi:hypothetical protein